VRNKKLSLKRIISLVILCSFLSFSITYAISFPLLKEEYEKELKKNPNNPEILFNLLVVYGADGNLEKVFEIYKSLEKKFPNYIKSLKVEENLNDPFSMYKSAFINCFTGKNNLAIYYFEKLYDLYPNDDWIIAYLAYLYYLDENIGEVEQLVNKGLKINNNNEALHALFCALNLKKGRYFSALKEYFITMNILQKKGYKTLWKILRGLQDDIK